MHKLQELRLIIWYAQIASIKTIMSHIFKNNHDHSIHVNMEYESQILYLNI